MYLLVCLILYQKHTSMYNQCMNSSSSKLIETAQALLWERGYVGMSPRAIQDRAGVGQGSMYHHFRSKSALAIAAEEQTAGIVKAEMDTTLSCPPKDPEARLLKFLRMERDVLKGCRIGRLAADPDVVTNDALRRPIEETFAWMTARLEKLILEIQATGKLEMTLDARTLATTIIAVRQGGYVLARAANSTEPYAQAIEGLISLFIKRKT